jgi:predicted MFS family arabinose efflux permease
MTTPFNLPLALFSIIALRTILNAAYRAPLPFLSDIALALNAEVSSLGWLATAFSLSGLLGLLSGAMERKLSRRNAMFTSMFIFIAACFILPFISSLVVAAFLFLMIGASKVLYEPQSLAFLGDYVPYETRGKAIGLVELSWALAWIFGVVLLGFLVERGAWSMLFVITGASAIPFTFMVARFATASSPIQPQSVASVGARIVLSNANALRMIIFGVLILSAATMATLVYSPWFVERFNLSPSRLGVASIVIGLADAIGELASALAIDRFGKRVSLLASSAFFAASLIFFWLSANVFAYALIGLFCIFFSFEFSLVASFAVLSEVAPTERATMIGFGAAANAIGRTIVSFFALQLFQIGRLTLPILLAAGMVAVAFAVASKVRVESSKLKV